MHAFEMGNEPDLWYKAFCAPVEPGQLIADFAKHISHHPNMSSAAAAAAASSSESPLDVDVTQHTTSTTPPRLEAPAEAAVIQARNAILRQPTYMCTAAACIA